MSRLIEPSDIIDVFDIMRDKSGSVVWEQAIQIAKEINKVDAVPVVRCKDCKHRDAENGVCVGRGWPMQLVPDDGFCDKGERSEE